MSSRARALSLYRRILRTHRQKLPYHLRELGDTYVREEFKRHKKADSKWLPNFFNEWEGYLSHLDKQAPVEAAQTGGQGGAGAGAGGIGRDLDPSLMQAMNEEQRQQLKQLRTEAAKLYKDG